MSAYTNHRRRQTIQALNDKESRDAYVEEHIRQGLAFQIRATRELRGWTQSELGERAGKPQPVISQLEDPDYGSYTLSTLRRVASALDVALVVRFVPFSQLVDYTTNVYPADLHVVSFDADEQLRTGLDAEEPLEFTPPTATQRRRLGEASTTYDAEHQGD